MKNDCSSLPVDELRHWYENRSFEWPAYEAVGETEGAMRLLTLLCTGAMACAIAMGAQASYMDGNKLRDLLDVAARAEGGKSKGVEDLYGAGLAVGYVAGIVDTYNGLLLCGTPNVTLGEVIAIVKQRIDDHPDELDRPADWIVVKALSTAYPCKPK
jgi:Rap1a immunity proteins